MVTGNSVADEKKSESTGGFCGQCGTAKTGAKFCGQCGTAFGSSSAVNSKPSSGANTPQRSPSPRASGRIPTVKAGGAAATAGLGGPAINQGCGKCGKAVFFAEQVNAAGRQWHAECFKCSECKKGLESHTLAEKDEMIFCSSCYSKKFGPKGFGIGSHSVHTK